MQYLKLRNRRLLIFIYSMGGGGAERATANLANYWAENGWVIAIVTLSPQCDDFYELNPSITRISLNLAANSGNTLIGLAQNLRRVVALRKELRQFSPDFALAMMTGANVLLALASWGLPNIVTVGSERTYPPHYPLGVVWEWLRRNSYRNLDAVVAQTLKGARWLQANTSARRTAVIPNPVSWPLTSRIPHLAVEKICGDGRKKLLAVGRLSSEKQFTLLVNCFNELASRHPEWDLIILGEGPLRSSLESQVREIGLENRICFPGRAGNIGDWYESASLYVLCSQFEGFPNTLVEAMAYGLPVVSFDCDTGPGDIIRNGTDGILVPDANSKKLQAKLDELMSNECLREKLAERAADVQERFSIGRISGTWELLFEEILNDKVTCR